MTQTVTLTPWEMLLAAQAGVMRQVENCKKGRTPYHGAGTQNDWQLHIEGCLGEYALSKFLGIHWSGKGNLRAPDVGTVDVRTASQNHHTLILHDADPDDRTFWLLCGINGQYNVKGWITAAEGKQKCHWKDPGTGRPAYFVPQSALHPPS